MRLMMLVGLSLAMLTACSGADPAVMQGRAFPTDIVLAPDSISISGLVPKQTTLEQMLRAQGLAGEAVQGIVAATRTVFNPRRLRSLQPFVLERTIDGALRRFQYEIDPDQFLRVEPVGSVDESFRAAIVPIPKTLAYRAIAGTIDETSPSLFESIEESGERAELAVMLAGVFGGEIDFNSEVQRDDRFAVAFERFTREDGPDSYGDIVAAEFENDGRMLRAFRFTPPGGKPAYYDEHGRSMRRFFLRSPLKFEPRITSRFSSRRMHPVLHTTRAHRGVDYGAPPGAPVVAIASGTVISATTDRVNGRMVHLRHPSGYESYYLHLSAFAKGIRAGTHVTQGELVGKVGSTGLATGPHLHYGLKKNGQYVDPLREQRKLPPGEPIPPSAMAAFTAERDRLTALIDTATQPHTRPAPDTISADTISADKSSADNHES